MEAIIAKNIRAARVNAAAKIVALTHNQSESPNRQEEGTSVGLSSAFDDNIPTTRPKRATRPTKSRPPKKITGKPSGKVARARPKRRSNAPQFVESLNETTEHFRDVAGTSTANNANITAGIADTSREDLEGIKEMLGKLPSGLLNSIVRELNGKSTKNRRQLLKERFGNDVCGTDFESNEESEHESGLHSNVVTDIDLSSEMSEDESSDESSANEFLTPVRNAGKRKKGLKRKRSTVSGKRVPVHKRAKGPSTYWISGTPPEPPSFVLAENLSLKEYLKIFEKYAKVKGGGDPDNWLNLLKYKLPEPLLSTFINFGGVSANYSLIKQKLLQRYLHEVNKGTVKRVTFDNITCNGDMSCSDYLDVLFTAFIKKFPTQTPDYNVILYKKLLDTVPDKYRRLLNKIEAQNNYKQIRWSRLSQLVRTEEDVLEDVVERKKSSVYIDSNIKTHPRHSSASAFWRKGNQNYRNKDTKTKSVSPERNRNASRFSHSRSYYSKGNDREGYKPRWEERNDFHEANQTTRKDWTGPCENCGDPSHSSSRCWKRSYQNEPDSTYYPSGNNSYGQSQQYRPYRSLADVSTNPIARGRDHAARPPINYSNMPPPPRYNNDYVPKTCHYCGRQGHIMKTCWEMGDDLTKKLTSAGIVPDQWKAVIAKQVFVPASTNQGNGARPGETTR